jgi:hypothetical protein
MTVTRNGVTQFSDWAVGRSVGPTAVTFLSLSARQSVDYVISLLFVLMAAGSGLWLGRRRKG